MFVITLKFAEKSKAPPLMGAHSAWIRRGFDDGVFVLAGSLQSSAGGVILAHGLSRSDIDRLVSEDPFVAGGVVQAEILEIAPARTDERLAFLKD